MLLLQASGGGGDADSGRDFASSLALLVLGGALVSERLYGCGMVEQMELGHPHLQPVLVAISAVLGLAAVWPPAKKPAAGGSSATELLRGAAGRLGFAGLSAALAVELWTGNGLLDMLELETGLEALSELEAVLTFLLCERLQCPPPACLPVCLTHTQLPPCNPLLDIPPPCCPCLPSSNAVLVVVSPRKTPPSP